MKPTLELMLKEWSLNQVERAYNNGLICEADLRAYLEAWNNTKGRFTTATLLNGTIRTVVKP